MSSVLDEHLAAENAHDLDRIMATYVARPLIVLNGQRIEGVEAVRRFHAAFGFGGGGAGASFSDVNVAERHRHPVNASTFILEQTLSGTHTGRWLDLEPTGHRFSVHVCTVYSFEAGKLASERVYFDLAWLRKQLSG